mmetsp:Transcript_13765/g.43538  ORF Transcript_13765/g.43538 Transcript_13765/m.43538 type:complete len:213 (+) Transcript_13765:465-1103(+)
MAQSVREGAKLLGRLPAQGPHALGAVDPRRLSDLRPGLEERVEEASADHGRGVGDRRPVEGRAGRRRHDPGQVREAEGPQEPPRHEAEGQRSRRRGPEPLRGVQGGVCGRRVGPQRPGRLRLGVRGERLHAVPVPRGQRQRPGRRRGLRLDRGRGGGAAKGGGRYRGPAGGLERDAADRARGAAPGDRPGVRGARGGLERGRGTARGDEVVS